MNKPTLSLSLSDRASVGIAVRRFHSKKIMSMKSDGKRICPCAVLTSFLCIKISCFLFLEQPPWVGWSRSRRRWCCRGLVGADLLLRVQGAQRAAHWEQQQQAESCGARHAALPPLNLHYITDKYRIVERFLVFWYYVWC